jgi:hypothetical protein
MWKIIKKYIKFNEDYPWNLQLNLSHRNKLSVFITFDESTLNYYYGKLW